MTDPSQLSPAAQAVLDAAHDGANGVLFDIGDDSPVPMCVAAALRAAADQMCTHHSKSFLYSIADYMKLHAIATELENAQ